MNLHKSIAIIFALCLSSCNAFQGAEAEYPLTREQREEKRIGKITGEQGIVVSGGSSSSSYSPNIQVNSYLWRASLDTVYRLPVISADPFGGTVLTDWYTLDSKDKTRFKVNIFITSSELRSDAIRVAAFKQIKNAKGAWVDQKGSDDLAQEIENKILLRARELKFAHKK